MSDYFEIDFLDVESSKSGDAIPLRYKMGEELQIHIIDGGFQDTGRSVVNHVRKYYDNPDKIDHVVVTHPDGDHAGGLRAVLEECKVENLWMIRPWNYVDHLIDRFARYTSTDGLRERLKQCYPHLAALEAIANERGIPIHEPFQGAQIGRFTVLAPTRPRYLDLVVSSDRTPEPAPSERLAEESKGIWGVAKEVAHKVVDFIKGDWGEEKFSKDETSPENDMSVVQYANLCGKRILLTGDAGRKALNEAADYAPLIGLNLPGIDRFQVPHHGSRRNVDTDTLDRWLGPRLETSLGSEDEFRFTGVISAAKQDKEHPRKAVIRAIHHRGGRVVSTEGKNVQTHANAPSREGWGPVSPLPYPAEQEK